MKRISISLNSDCRRKVACSSSRRGAIIIFAMLALLVASMLGAALLRTAALSKQQVQREGLQVQATWLADSGVMRGIAQFQSQKGYTGEFWVVPSEQLTGGRSAEVQIRVTPSTTDPTQTVIEARSEYPQGSPTAVRVTRSLTLPVHST